MTKDNRPDKNKKEEATAESIDHDWRDPSKPRNSEDDVIVDGWRRRADGTFEKIDEIEEEK